MSRNLLTPRRELKPVEYPEVLPFKEAIRHSYWVHDEYPWSGDVQDYRVSLTDTERAVVTRAILAISQVEVQVKSFWRDLGTLFQKPEIDAVGVTFAESEVRHADGYSHLLDLLGLNSLFSAVQEEVPELRDRMDYLDKHSVRMLDLGREKDLRVFVERLVLFSVFIEYVSLFSQFYVVKSFHKHRNMFRGLSNLVDATSKEEELHGKFGFLLINLLREEYPRIFDEKMDDAITVDVMKAVRAEQKVLNWIFELGDLDFIAREDAMDFTLHRVNTALNECGFGHLIGERGLGVKNPEAFEWFEVELIGTKHYDFFNQRPTNYNRMGQSFSAEELF